MNCFVLNSVAAPAKVKKVNVYQLALCLGKVYFQNNDLWNIQYTHKGISKSLFNQLRKVNKLGMNSGGMHIREVSFFTRMGGVYL